MSAWRDDEISSLLDCPSEALRWAALGYRVGWRDGRYELLTLEARIDPAARAIASSTLKQPPWHEIVHRRDAQFRYCPTRCMRCSRCIAMEAHERRGGRDYQGLAAETLIAHAQRGAA